MIKKAPEICQKCWNLDGEYDDNSHKTHYTCKINIFLPHKKQTCYKFKALQIKKAE